MKYLTYFIMTSILFIPEILAAKQYSKFFGTAKNESGQIVYYEDHQVEFSDEGYVSRIQTRYLRPNEQRNLFARLDSQFNKSKYVPESVFEDMRHEHREETSLDIEKNQLIIKHIETSEDKTSRETLNLTKQMVMGQGYHNYIITHLDKFKPNEKRTLDFVVPAKQTFYKFDLTYLGKKSEDAKYVTLRLDITNWFLKLFASKIEVDYDPKTKRLMAYRGLTNIVNDEGDNQSLNITFEYPEEKK